MIIGNGLIARAFMKIKHESDGLIIFASGVSNSKQLEENEFLREKKMILEHIHNEGKFIYFSTCSIYDESLKDSRYIKHKLEMEKMISDIKKDFLIIRLPNIVGPAGNGKTMFNYFNHQIINNNILEIQKNATRYILDIDDVTKGTIELVNSAITNRIINLAFHNRISIVDIINCFEIHLNKKAKCNFKDSGISYQIDTTDFMSITNQFDEEYYSQPKYTLEIIKKYF